MSGPDAYEFIRTCLSHRPVAARREVAQSFLEADADWETLQREARRHRVLSLFYHVLEKLLGPRLPSPILDRIQQHRRGVRVQNTFVIQELKRVTQRFEEAGVPLLVMKGPVLAETAYGDIALRQSVDADVAVPEDQFSEADRLLQEIGYEHAAKRKALTGWRKSLARYLDGQWEFARGNAFVLDVHTRLMPPRYSFPSDFHRFWQRARRVQLTEEAAVQGFSPEDQVLVLAHHGIKNQWRALRHVVDIAAVVREEEDLDGERLLSRAEKMEVTRALILALCLAGDLLDITLPTDDNEWSLSDSMQDVAAAIKTYLQNRSRKSALTYRERVQLQVVTKDTLGGQLRYAAHSLLQHLWSVLPRP